MVPAAAIRRAIGDPRYNGANETRLVSRILDGYYSFASAGISPLCFDTAKRAFGGALLI